MNNEDRLEFDEAMAAVEDNILAKTRNVALDVVATSHAIKSYTSGEKEWNCSCYACQYARSDRRVMDAIARNVVKSYPKPII
jgi:hypothetical protein